jgi:hypothetical protein
LTLLPKISLFLSAELSAMMIDDVWSFNGVQENFSLQWFTKSLLDIVKRAWLSIGSGSVIVSLSTRFFVGCFSKTG